MTLNDLNQITPPGKEFPFSDQEFRFLAGLANAKSGILLPEQKKDMVYGRLVRRLRALKLDSFAAYCDYLQSAAGDDEIGNLINSITTNLTSFFREKHHFEHLAAQLDKCRGSKNRKLRLWSAACSSGMEPYSMAMTLRGAIPDLDSWDALILATDIDTNMINTGATGEYNESDVEDVPHSYTRYIDSLPDKKVGMSDKLKSLIRFKQLNLLEEWPMKHPFDFVFCRNVVIYFDKPTKEVLFDRMADMMTPGGILYIGHSENLNGISDRFELIGRTTYQRVK